MKDNVIDVFTKLFVDTNNPMGFELPTDAAKILMLLSQEFGEDTPIGKVVNSCIPKNVQFKVEEDRKVLDRMFAKVPSESPKELEEWQPTTGEGKVTLFSEYPIGEYRELVKAVFPAILADDKCRELSKIVAALTLQLKRN